MQHLHLLFVYNADGNLFSTITDFAHKIFSPQTYACNLCALTYGSFTMKQEWKHFLSTLPAEKSFLHKNEFEKLYGPLFSLSAIFFLKENKPIVLLSADETNVLHSLPELEKVLLQKIDSCKALLHD